MHLTADQVVALCVIVGVLTIAIIAAAIIIYRKLQSARIERVSNESNRLRDIVQINARYSFDYDCLPIQRHASLKSKKQFDAFDSVKYLKTELVENIDFITLWQKRVRTNRCWWDAYINELNAMPPSQFENEKDRMVEDELLCRRRGFRLRQRSSVRIFPGVIRVQREETLISMNVFLATER